MIDEIKNNGYTLKNCDQINIIMGKNGCGKSQLLRSFYSNKPEYYSNISYISPERGGVLKVDGTVITQLPQENWEQASRNKNQVNNFLETSVAKYDVLYKLIAGKVETTERQSPSYSFQSEILDKINNNLDNIIIVDNKSKLGFEIRSKSSEISRDNPSTLSSGESQFISLVIEVLHSVYVVSQEYESSASVSNLLLLIDEPDVHLHPDLQEKFVKFLIDVTKDKPITIVLATHSSAIVSGLSENALARIAFMGSGANALNFIPIDSTLQDIIPIFGAHSLTNTFNHKSILLVEGDDEARIWQQAIRSSQGRIKIWPCSVDGIGNLSKYEKLLNSIIEGVYDSPRAFSLRDSDGIHEKLDDEGSVQRFRLQCRASENLLLSDEVLNELKSTWEELKVGIQEWLGKNPENKYRQKMQEFIDTSDRKNADVKDLRNIFMSILGYNRDWETLVGKAIAKLSVSSTISDTSLYNFLGKKLVDALDLCSSNT